MMDVGSADRIKAFLRSFLVQGSWNYRTMLGGGLAWAILPVLRRLHAGDPESLERSLARHARRFNVHPYLADLALGACIRMEEEGVEAAMIERFKTAVGGSLGGLGDRLVWAGWFPVSILGGLALVLGGVAPLTGVVAFLLVYNVGHLGLRIWGFRTGLLQGRAVGGRLASLDLGRGAEVLSRVGAILLGLVLGLLLARGPWPGIDAGWEWTVAAVGGFILGARGGQEVWRPALRVVAGLLFCLFVLGAYQ